MLKPQPGGETPLNIPCGAETEQGRGKSRAGRVEDIIKRQIMNGWGNTQLERRQGAELRARGAPSASRPG